MDNFLHSPVTSSLLGPNILLNALFSNTLSLHTSLIANHQVSQPYKTTGRILILYTFILNYFGSKLVGLNNNLFYKNCVYLYKMNA